ncbi:probable plastidic glucose transporter 3 [Nymphaea colorata]|uniref:probable plastidic glucose transporter 3 n=1 Tax=Nymphaea colorata TaxID=210225 RepID=UPI00214F400C|nr:probable plastidic glucose transporter 3 [Nymphaea colorata]
MGLGPAVASLYVTELYSDCNMSWYHNGSFYWNSIKRNSWMKGRCNEAEAELERLLSAAHVKLAIAELSRLDKGDDAESVRLSELLYGRHFKVVMIGSILFGLQQLSGINAVFYFSSAVFKRAGVPSNLANVCVGLSNLTGSIVAMLLMDKLGRKMLLLGSFLGMVDFAFG